MSEATDLQIKDLEDRVEELAQHIQFITESFFAVSYAEPNKLTEPMIRVADGTSWNPGSGQGIYIYLGGVWSKL